MEKRGGWICDLGVGEMEIRTEIRYAAFIIPRTAAVFRTLAEETIVGYEEEEPLTTLMVKLTTLIG